MRSTSIQPTGVSQPSTDANIGARADITRTSHPAIHYQGYDNARVQALQQTLQLPPAGRLVPQPLAAQSLAATAIGTGTEVTALPRTLTVTDPNGGLLMTVSVGTPLEQLSPETHALMLCGLSAEDIADVQHDPEIRNRISYIARSPEAAALERGGISNSRDLAITLDFRFGTNHAKQLTRFHVASRTEEVTANFGPKRRRSSPGPETSASQAEVQRQKKSKKGQGADLELAKTVALFKREELLEMEMDPNDPRMCWAGFYSWAKQVKKLGDSSIDKRIAVFENFNQFLCDQDTSLEKWLNIAGNPQVDNQVVQFKDVRTTQKDGSEISRSAKEIAATALADLKEFAASQTQGTDQIPPPARVKGTGTADEIADDLKEWMPQASTSKKGTDHAAALKALGSFIERTTQAQSVDAILSGPAGEIDTNQTLRNFCADPGQAGDARKNIVTALKWAKVMRELQGEVPTQKLTSKLPKDLVDNPRKWMNRVDLQTLAASSSALPGNSFGVQEQGGEPQA